MPTLTEALAQDYPEQFEATAALSSRFAPVDAHRALFEAADVDVASFYTRRILGIGLTREDLFQARGEPAIPAIVVAMQAPSIVRLLPSHEVDTIGTQTVDEATIGSLRRLHDEVNRQMAVEPFAVIAIPAPVEQIAPGDEAHCGAGRGTFGARVT